MLQQIKNKAVSSLQGENTSVNIIGHGTTIEGEVRSSGDIRIDGLVKGSVATKAKLVIGVSGVVEGDVLCQNADISGSIRGKTVVTEMLFLKASGKVNGDIHTGKLVVEVGASFTGNCNMGPMIKDIKHADRPAEAAGVKEKTA
jgi:cytoskeletal protein CcmA (bactofilin family)